MRPLKSRISAQIRPATIRYSNELLRKEFARPSIKLLDCRRYLAAHGVRKSEAGDRMQGRPRPRASSRSRVPREFGDAELPAGLPSPSPDRSASPLVLPPTGSDKPCLQASSASRPHDRRRGGRHPANRVSSRRIAFRDGSPGASTVGNAARPSRRHPGAHPPRWSRKGRPTHVQPAASCNPRLLHIVPDGADSWRDS